MKARTLGGLWLAALLGCAGARTGKLLPERARVVRAVPTFGQEGKGQLELDLLLDNRTHADELSRFRCDIYLNDKWFASSEGLLNRPLLPSPVQVPVHLTLPWALRRSGTGSPSTDRVGVEVRGELEISRQGAPERVLFRRWMDLKVRGAVVPVPDETF